MKLILNIPKVEKYMRERGWDERDLAKQIGVSHVQVYRVMRGQRFPGNDFLAGLKAIGVQLDELTKVVS